ncbi:potassium transporter Kup [Lutibacter sp.]|uniref:potassium transporter Kup n=1 Tax=Lutibacter sp. TaxID=1925666 RepID=UPI0025C47A2E|nr:potassium transporter Kup [Lutibacter sp.]MCF6181113.1 potassium transporter Kup [Lutibacter sp.]
MNSTKKDKNKLGLVTLTALGIVFGDIGTSPLYAVRECFYGDFSVPISNDNIFGVISLIFYALIIVISLKYLTLVFRADNEGEGGILALMYLVLPKKNKKLKIVIITFMGLFGATLLYGDGMITPAISVLSAIEGVNVATSNFQSYVIPITIAILFGLFFFQKFGTKKVGFIFGPLILIWFVIIAILGLNAIINYPVILKAANPYWAYKFFTIHHWHGIFILGAIFLVVTGGEALYADIGHFGRKPIKLAWFFIVFPSLILNYFGQGALLLKNPSLVANPFYHLAPTWAIYPLVFMATIATVIASQAVISGAFSLTFQALQLGYFPRVKITHTSKDERGQIYIPQINWILFIGTISLVLLFKTSANLASAYGVAVSTTMVITTILTFFAMKDLWKWKLSVSITITILLLCVDVAFMTANYTKIPSGGWVPLVIASCIYLVMTTWHKGREILHKQSIRTNGLLSNFIKSVNQNPPQRVPGVAIYFVSDINYTPAALILNLKHNKILHQQVIILSVVFKKVPHVKKVDRLTFEKMSDEIYKAIINYGFMDYKNIPKALELLKSEGISITKENTTYILGRETFILQENKAMPIWRESLFSFLSKNSVLATKYFNLPKGNVLEIGSQISL